MLKKWGGREESESRLWEKKVGIMNEKSDVLQFKLAENCFNAAVEHNQAHRLNISVRL